MKKIFLTALCATTIIYGGDKSSHALIIGRTLIEEGAIKNAAGRSFAFPSEEWPTLKEYIKTGMEHDALKKAHNALQIDIGERNATIRSLEMQLYRQRRFLRSAVLVTSCTTIFSIISIWKPTFFSEKFSSLKQAVNNWKRTPFTKPSQPITQTQTTNSVKSNDQ